MPPLRYVLLKVLRAGSVGTAVFAALVLAIELWKTGGDVTALNPGFTILIGIMLVAGLWLARSIAREIAANPPEHGS